MAKNTTIHIRNGHEHGTFFVEESDVVPRSTGGFQASATWTCHSSYGVFGYHWNSMGESFGEFIKEIDNDYLLNKISSRRLDTNKMLKNVKAAIIARRKSKAIDSETAREALKTLESMSHEFDGEVLCHEIYMSTEISDTGIDLCNCETQEWDGQALGFVRKLWPKFVEAFNQQEKAACQTP